MNEQKREERKTCLGFEELAEVPSLLRDDAYKGKHEEGFAAQPWALLDLQSTEESDYGPLGWRREYRAANLAAAELLSVSLSIVQQVTNHEDLCHQCLACIRMVNSVSTPGSDGGIERSAQTDRHWSGRCTPSCHQRARRPDSHTRPATRRAAICLKQGVDIRRDPARIGGTNGH
jgi:ferredoxin